MSLDKRHLATNTYYVTYVQGHSRNFRALLARVRRLDEVPAVSLSTLVLCSLGGHVCNLVSKRVVGSGSGNIAQPAGLHVRRLRNVSWIR